MTDKKTTAFDRSTQAEIVEPPDDEEVGEQRSMVPRAIFTRDSRPDMSKMPISQLRIAQGMTAEVKERKAVNGQFVLSNFQAKDEVILVPFGAPDIRVYKPDPKAPPVCHAPTGDFGFGTPGGVCADCPLSQWGEYNEQTKTSAAPKCKEGILVRAYSITHKSIVDFQFMAGDRGKGVFVQQQAMSYGWGGFAIKVTSTTKENKKGSWFVPVIEMLDEVPGDQQEIIAKWYEIFLASQIGTKAEALQQLAARAE